MGGITLDDFTQSVAYREIFGRGEAQGKPEASFWVKSKEKPRSPCAC